MTGYGTNVTAVVHGGGGWVRMSLVDETEGNRQCLSEAVAAVWVITSTGQATTAVTGISSLRLPWPDQQLSSFARFVALLTKVRVASFPVSNADDRSQPQEEQQALLVSSLHVQHGLMFVQE